MRERPASPAQGTLFSLAQRAEDPSQRLAQLSVSFGEPVPVPLLTQTWERLASLHGALRSSFRKGHSKPLIRTEHDGAKASWRELDWSDVPPTELAERWASALADEASRPIDPQSPPPIRFLAIRLPGGSSHLLATYPRFLLDEESWFFLLCEWLEALDGRLPRIPEPDANQAQEGTTPAAPCDLLWWKQHLAKARPTQLQFFGGEAPPNEERILFDRETTSALVQACKKHEATTRDATFAAWAFLLARLSLSPDAVILSAMDAPDQPADALGSRLNFLPCQLPISGAQSLADLVRQAALLEKARLKAGGTALDELPLPEGFAGHAGDFLAAFSWLPPSLKDRVPDVFPRWINLDARIMDHPVHDLELEARDGARMSLRLRAATLPPFEVSRLLSGIEHLLLTLVSSPETPLAEIEIPGSPTTPSRDGEPSVQPVPIQEIIADSADASPERNAIEDANGAVLTYREVDDYATALAASLRVGNLGEGWTVSICLAPSPWVPVAILGVLRAGDTCALLDPEASSAWLESQTVATDTELVICDSSTKNLFEASGKKLLVIDQQWEEVAAAPIPEGEPAKPKVAMVFTGTEFVPPPPLPHLSPGLLSSACTRTIQIAEIEAGDRVAVTAAAGTASFATTLLAALAAGTTSVLSREPGFGSLGTSHCSFAGLTSEEFSGWVAALRRAGDPLPESLRCLVIDARETPVSAATYKAWQKISEGHCRWISYLSPCDAVGIGLQFTDTQGSSEPLETVPCGRAARGAGFQFKNLAGFQPPFGYPGMGSFQPAGIPNPVGEFLAWRDAHGLVHRIPQDPKSLKIVEVLRRVAGVFDAAWDPERPEVAWIVADSEIPNEAMALVWKESSLPGEPPSRLVRVDAIPLRHGRVHTEALRIPEPPTPPKSDPEVARPPTPVSEEKPASAATASASPVVTAPLEPQAPKAEPDLKSDLQFLGGSQEAPLLILLADSPSLQSSLDLLISALGDEWNLATMPWRISTGAWDTEVTRVVAAIESGSGGADIHILGLGGAGLLALETARRLRTAGREVPYLVIAGCNAPFIEKPGLFGALKRSLGGKKEVKPLHGPCGVVLTRDLPPESEELWLHAATDAIVERLNCSSSDLSGQGLEALARAMKRLDNEG